MGHRNKRKRHHYSISCKKNFIGFALPTPRNNKNRTCRHCPRERTSKNHKRRTHYQCPKQLPICRDISKGLPYRHSPVSFWEDKFRVWRAAVFANSKPSTQYNRNCARINTGAFIVLNQTKDGSQRTIHGNANNNAIVIASAIKNGVTPRNTS